MRQGHYSNDLAFSHPFFVPYTPRVHTAIFNTSSGRQYFLNGKLWTSDSSLTALSSYDNSALGKFVGQYYVGYLGEVLIFNQVLSLDDRYLVDQYLAKKWGIDMDTDGDGMPNAKDKYPTNNTLVIDRASYAPTLAGLSSTASDNLKIWIDVSSANMLKQDLSNNTVSQVYNLAGSGSAALQWTAASSPIYVDNGFNGRPSLYFDGIADHLVISGLSINTPKLTYFIVGKRSAVKANTSMMSAISTSAQSDTDGSSLIAFFEGDNGYFLAPYRLAVKSTIQPHPGNNVESIFSSIFDGATNVSYLNGEPYSSTSASGAMVFNDMYNGSRAVSNASQYPFNGYISEIMVFTTDLSAADRSIVNQYLSSKWGIGVDSDEDGIPDNLDTYPLDGLRVINIQSYAPTLNSVSAIANLKVWFDASHPIGVVKDKNNQVKRWYDLSANKNNVVASNDIVSPQFVLNGLNNKSSVLFDGISDVLTKQGANLNTSNKLTYYVVASRVGYANDTALVTLVDSSLSDGSSGSLIVGLENDNANIKDYHGAYLSGFARPSLNTPFILSSIYNGSVNKMYFNGTNSDSVASTAGFTPTVLNIGSRYANTGPWGYNNSLISEILIFNTDLSLDDRYKVDQYLSTKWGIDVDTDGDGIPNALDSYPTDATKAIDVSAYAPKLNLLSSAALSSLKFWVDASNTKFIKKETDNSVSRWMDLSGQGNYLTQSVKDKQPIYNATGILQGASIDFDGTNDALKSIKNISANNNFTLYVISKAIEPHQIDAVNDRYAGGEGQKYLLFPIYGENLQSGSAGMGVSMGTNGVSIYEHGYDYLPSRVVYQNTIPNPSATMVYYSSRVPSLYVNGSFVAKADGVGEKGVVIPAMQVGGDSNMYFSRRGRGN